MSVNRESKEEIKDRMIRTALEYWNIKKIENLDPFIRLLIEALAMQLHHVSDDIADIEVRTMRRLSEILLPEVVTVVQPSHAILHVNPLIDNMSTNLFDGFSITAPFLGRKDDTTFSFYPVCKTQLRKGTVKMLVTEGNVYEIMPDQNKKLLLKKNTIPENVNKVFLGIEFAAQEVELKNLSVYFDFPNLDRRADYLHYLSSSVWKWKGDQLDIHRGLYEEKSEEGRVLTEFFTHTKTDYSVNSNVMDYYKDSYITIDSSQKVYAEDFSKMPFGFVSYDYNEYEQVFDKKLLWLEIEMPPYFNSSILSGMQVSINTFPVVNKEMHTKNNLVKKDFGVIPLPTFEREYFFDVIEVTDDKGKKYKDSYGYKENKTDDCFSLRQGGCESFDKRNIKEYLIRLQGLLEDELSLFSSISGGNNFENLNLIESLLHKIDLITKDSSGEVEMPYYLFVEPPQQSTFFYLKYWTSFGPIANGMRIGATLNLLGDSFGDYEMPMFLTTTVGGKEPLSERERIAKFKYILSSRNRIVTNNDIRNFFYSEMSDSLTDIKIEKGISTGVESGLGLQRTIDIHLIVNKNDWTEKQKKQMLTDLSRKLKEQSPMTFNYRLFID
ncbi:MAG: type VI secretion system baseplate subunit TssF [Paludibacteraceae bacterium]|nr:type VI secretion system baseplate subunit TssF [Paludibacteraceae bacterium]